MVNHFNCWLQTELLLLILPTRTVVDGRAEVDLRFFASMERISHILDSDANWGINDGQKLYNGLNASNNPLVEPQNLTKFYFCTSASYPAIEVLINEVAWAGTIASSDDEWIELYNPSLTNTIDISGWRIVTESGSLDFIFPAATAIAPDSYFLMERARPEVTDASPSFIYFGALSDLGEILRLAKT